MGTIGHYNLKISGRVQGVGYRYFALRIAQKFGLTGYVRNNPDGTVYIEVEGNETLLKKFVAQCKTGPGWSNVERVEVTEFPVRGYTDFIIKY